MLSSRYDADRLCHRAAAQPQGASRHFGRRPIEARALWRRFPRYHSLPRRISVRCTPPSAAIGTDLWARVAPEFGRTSRHISTEQSHHCPGASGLPDIRMAGRSSLTQRRRKLRRRLWHMGNLLGARHRPVAAYAHAEMTAVFRVIEGSYRFWCGNEMIEAPVGPVVVLPPNVPHHWRNVSDGMAG